MALPYAFCISMQSAFVALIALVLAPLGVEQSTADWMGVVASISGFVSGVSSGYIVDRLRCGLKLPLLFVVAGGGLGYGWLALTVLGILPVRLGKGRNV